MKNYYRFDNSNFNILELKRAIENNDELKILKRLLYIIRYLDNIDNKDSKHLYKHVIYAGNTTNAKLVCGGLKVLGIRNVYDREHKLIEDNLNNGFALLTKGNVYQRPVSKRLIKRIKQIYNTRPDNTIGSKIRIIVLDSAYKEGLDLFDVKYFHIFDKLLSVGEEKQVMGRALRNCGHAGLPFNGGWKLYVYHYYDRPSRDVSLSSELAKICYYSSIDFPLTYSVHEQISTSTYVPDKNISKLFFGEILKLMRDNLEPYDMNIYTRYRQIGNKGGDFKGFRENIENQQSYYWNEVNLVNNCESKEFSLNPTQKFIKDYFTPVSNIKGLLLWHSAGSGKTCSGLAVASTFAKKKYNILWVTRSSLIPDIQKNVDNCYKGDIKSKEWIKPMSYKTFTNMLNEKNKRYEEMLKRNPKDNLLRNTLLIIDEAHKLFDGSMAKQETPDVDILQRFVMKSKSCRLLLMTATPLIKQEMILIKLMNMIVKNRMPDNIDEFREKYLENNQFTDEGAKEFIENIYKNISYLDMSNDLSRFAMPVHI